MGAGASVSLTCCFFLHRQLSLSTNCKEKITTYGLRVGGRRWLFSLRVGGRRWHAGTAVGLITSWRSWMESSGWRAWESCTCPTTWWKTGVSSKRTEASGILTQTNLFLSFSLLLIGGIWMWCVQVSSWGWRSCRLWFVAPLFVL